MTALTLPRNPTLPAELLQLELEAEAAYAALERAEAERRLQADRAVEANRNAFLDAAREQLPSCLADYLADGHVIWTARLSHCEPYITLPGYHSLRVRFERCGEGDGWRQVPVCQQSSDRLSVGECWWEVALPESVDRPRHCHTLGAALWSARIRSQDEADIVPF